MAIAGNYHGTPPGGREPPGHVCIAGDLHVHHGSQVLRRHAATVRVSHQCLHLQPLCGRKQALWLDELNDVGAQGRLQAAAVDGAHGGGGKHQVQRAPASSQHCCEHRLVQLPVRPARLLPPQRGVQPRGALEPGLQPGFQGRCLAGIDLLEARHRSFRPGH